MMQSAIHNLLDNADRDSGVFQYEYTRTLIDLNTVINTNVGGNLDRPIRGGNRIGYPNRGGLDHSNQRNTRGVNSRGEQGRGGSRSPNRVGGGQNNRQLSRSGPPTNCLAWAELLTGRIRDVIMKYATKIKDFNSKSHVESYKSYNAYRTLITSAVNASSLENLVVHGH